MDSGFLKYRVKFLILSLLAIKPSHGYELSKTIEDLTLGEVKGGPGTIYPLLHDLEKEGLILEESIVERGRAKKVYRLTQRGAEILASHLDAFNDVMSRILTITTEASKALTEKGATPGRGCPPREVLDKLAKLRTVIDAYIRVVEERVEACEAQE